MNTPSLPISDQQWKALEHIVEGIDRNKIEFFQHTVVPFDKLVELSKLLFIGNFNENGEIQINPDLIEIVEAHADEIYFKEHENDRIYELGIDIETYSDVDLTETGVYPYTESDAFEILLFAYSINNSPVRVVDLACGELIPQRVLNALTDAEVLKTAYNASFERICISKYLGLPLGTYLDPAQWDCTMVRGARLALPMSLDQCGKVLRLENLKMKEGKALITYFSKPCKPTKANGMRTRNLPQHAPEKWNIFKRYCKRDVEVEQQIRRRVTRLAVTTTERQAWILDQKINDRGALCDLELANNASNMDDANREALAKEAIMLTGLSNPNSVSQLKEWLKQETGLHFPKVDKDTVKEMLPKMKSLKAKRVLQIRQELGKSSTAKYKAMLKCACRDHRVRGLFQFYGANRTGRFAGRLVQLQNLPQNHLPDLDHARNLVKHGTVEEISLEYGNVPQTLSELIRTAFIAKPNHVYYVCDFSAIEARVIAWLSGEEWVLDVFRQGGDIYCATASQMFKVPVEKHGRNADLRQNGKVSVLACGYGGGVEAMKKMGGEKMGLTESEMQENVTNWRNANPHTVRLWKHIETAARTALNGEALPIEKGIRFIYKWGGLSVTLPSKRELFYPCMYLDTHDNRLKFRGMHQEKKIWCDIETYGGKMTENIVQAIARDILIEVMLRLEQSGFNIVFHIHDETVIEVDPSKHTLKEVEDIFGQEISWAKGLPLKGAGYETPYYLKD